MTTTHKITHITDLAKLTEAEVVTFCKELPSLLSELRDLRTAVGGEINKIVPFITWTHDQKDELSVNLTVNGESVGRIPLSKKD